MIAPVRRSSWILQRQLIGSKRSSSTYDNLDSDLPPSKAPRSALRLDSLVNSVNYDAGILILSKTLFSDLLSCFFFVPIMVIDGAEDPATVDTPVVELIIVVLFAWFGPVSLNRESQSSLSELEKR